MCVHIRNLIACGNATRTVISICRLAFCLVQGVKVSSPRHVVCASPGVWFANLDRVTGLEQANAQIRDRAKMLLAKSDTDDRLVKKLLSEIEVSCVDSVCLSSDPAPPFVR